MKKPKIRTVKGNIEYKTQSVYLCSYKCPYCSTLVEDYSLNTNIVQLKCAKCTKLLQIKWPGNKKRPQIFEISFEQLEKLDKWKGNQDINKSNYQYIFTPTGIGMNIKVINKFNQEEIDLSDYEHW